MACGVPVIATAWGGPADYLDASCGILVNPSNPGSITQGFIAAMQKLIADPALRLQLGIAGRKRVEAHYDWNQKIDQILGIYEQTITSYRP